MRVVAGNEAFQIYDRIGKIAEGLIKIKIKPKSYWFQDNRMQTSHVRREDRHYSSQQGHQCVCSEGQTLWETLSVNENTSNSQPKKRCGPKARNYSWIEFFMTLNLTNWNSF